MSNETKQAKKIILPVTGMTCASCAATIEKGPAKLSGVSRVNVNLASEKATVNYLRGEASMADFKRAVEGAGYSIWAEVSAEGIAEPDVVMAAARREIRALKTKLIFAGSSTRVSGQA